MMVSDLDDLFENLWRYRLRRLRATGFRTSHRGQKPSRTISPKDPVKVQVRLRPPSARIETSFFIGPTRGVTCVLPRGTRYRSECAVISCGTQYRGECAVICKDKRVCQISSLRKTMFIFNLENITFLVNIFTRPNYDFFFSGIFVLF